MIRYLLLGAVVLGLSALTLTPAHYIPDLDNVSHLDKLVHVVAWGVLVIAIWAVLTTRLLSPTRCAVWAWLLAVAYGALVEGLQMVVPGRTADVLDFASNAAGATLGLYLRGLWARWRQRRRAAQRIGSDSGTVVVTEGHREGRTSL